MTTSSANHREPVRSQWATSSGNRFREVVYTDHRNRFRGPAEVRSTIGSPPAEFSPCQQHQYARGAHEHGHARGV
jgi:hypothetical protein